MKKFSLYFFILYILFNFKVFSSPKKKIIDNFINTKNISFNFTQKIKDKKELGSCIIEYPKLIYCLYDKKYKKVMVSNGKSIVIKNYNTNHSYIYPIDKTPLKYVLDKKYLLNKLEKLEPIKSNDNNIKFSIIEQSNEIIVFFNNKTLDLAGWKTYDVYQNEVLFQIKDIKKNLIIDKKLFILPKLNM